MFLGLQMLEEGGICDDSWHVGPAEEGLLATEEAPDVP